LRRLVAFGEAMIRFTTPVGVPLETATEFAAPVGGAELNVAIAARRQGMKSLWVSTLPQGPLGDLVARHVAANGVEGVLRRTDSGRLGLYFLEQAVPPRASRIVYDRSDTAFVSQPDPAVSWPDLLDADSYLVVSGITAAVGSEARRATDEAIEAARSAGASVAVDVNYRSSLWSIEDAFDWLKGVIDRVDVLSASREDLLRLGVSGSEEEIHHRAVELLDLRASVGAAKRIRGRIVEATIYAATKDGTGEAAVVAEIVDPVGAGDAMFGTFLAGVGRLPLDETVARAAGALVTAYGVAGDALTADPWTPDERGGVKR